MATDDLPARRGALVQLCRGLKLADARRPAEDATGPIVRAWWRVAVRPTPATFRAWSRRAGPMWIVASLLTGSLLMGAADAIGGLHVADIGLDLNAQGRYLAHPAVAYVLARVLATTLAMLPISLAVLLAVAVVTRERRPGGLRARWGEVLPPWSLAHPALGIALLVNSACMLGVAAVFQWLHATPPDPLASMALGLVSFPLWLIWAAVFLGYTLIVLLSAVWSVVPAISRGMVWLALGVYLAVGLPIGIAFTFVAQSLGIPGPLFGQ